MADELTEAEYRAWLTPRQALERLSSLGRYTAADSINERIVAGLVRVAAASLREKREEVRLFPMISPGLWEIAMPSQNHGLWARGDIVIGVRRAHMPPNELPFFGVRFEPSGIDQIRIDAGLADQVGQAQPALSEGAKKPISAAEIARFAKLYLGLWGEQSLEMKALAAMRATYPDYAIGRDPFLAKFRELRGPGKRGKPPNRGE